MNPEPDYSAAYVILRTERRRRRATAWPSPSGAATTSQVAAVEALAPLVVGLPVDECWPTSARSRGGSTGDSQLRWLGPEKGVIHMAAGAIVNAVWDLYAPRGRASRSGSCWPRCHRSSSSTSSTSATCRTRSPARRRWRSCAAPSRAGPSARRACSQRGYPAYTTTPGWLGYDDEKLVRLAKQAVADGFRQIKLKVGADRDDDVRRLAAGPRGGRTRRAHRRRRQPGVGRRRGDRAGCAPLAAVRPVLDRGAHLARRRARPRRDPQGASRRSRSPPASTRTTR